jgi:hypothetical protein
MSRPPSRRKKSLRNSKKSSARRNQKRTTTPRALRGKKQDRITRARKYARKHSPVTRKRTGGVRRQIAITDPRVARALGAMRREDISASVAARREGMKLNTFRERAGRYLHRSGRGKPWKARSEDELAVSMTILTSQGRVDVIVRNSRQRKLLHRYELALTAFRAGDEDAEATLKAFEGIKVAGHTLITDTKLLIQLEEAGQLDFDNLYTSFGGRS